MAEVMKDMLLQWLQRHLLLKINVVKVSKKQKPPTVTLLCYWNRRGTVTPLLRKVCERLMVAVISGQNITGI